MGEAPLVSPNARCTPEMPIKAQGLGAQLLSKVPKERSRSKAELERAELFALLCEHATEQAAEGRLVPGEESGE